MLNEIYSLTPEDDVILSAYAELPDLDRVGAYWQNDAVAPFRQRAKTFYINAQVRKCCYCKQTVPSDNHRLWDLEHILCRHEFPEYMFDPRNLSISCVDCNNAKSTSRVVRAQSYKRFPSRSGSYLIVHPNLDEYDLHIGVKFGLIYYSKGSKKGSYTITACNLARFAEWFEERKGPVGDERYEDDVTKLVFSKDRDEAIAVMRKLLTAFDSGEF